MGKTGAKGQREKNLFHAEDAEFAEETYQVKTLRSLRAWREIIKRLRTMAPRLDDRVSGVGSGRRPVNFVNPVSPV